MSIGDTGVSANYKVPRYIVKVVFAAGIVGASALGTRCLLVGVASSDGSMSANEIAPCGSEAEAAALAGATSPLARMAYQALRIPGVNLWLGALAEPSTGASAATATITIAGTVTAGGTLRFRLAGTTVTADVGAADSVATIATNIAAAFNAKSKLPATAAAALGVVTLTVDVKGIAGKDWILYYDKTGAPTGVTVTLAGSATVNTTGVRFGASSSGVGAVDVTTLLTKFGKVRFGRIGVDHNDSTNAGLWEGQLNDDAGPLVQLYEHVIFGHNGTLTDAKTLAQTNLNAFRAQVCWMRNSESHPAEISALVAAIRSVTEQTQPIPDYDNLLLESLAPQAFDDDIPSDTECNTALNAGVTPITTVNGSARMVRAITTYCLNGNDQDTRCLDIGDPVLADYVAMDQRLLWETEFRPANPRVGPDFPPEVDEPPEGVGTPKMWASAGNARMQDYYDSGWSMEPPTVPGRNALVADYDPVTDSIVSETPVRPRRVQHQLRNVVRQIHDSL